MLQDSSKYQLAKNFISLGLKVEVLWQSSVFVTFDKHSGHKSPPLKSRLSQKVNDWQNVEIKINSGFLRYVISIRVLTLFFKKHLTSHFFISFCGSLLWQMSIAVFFPQARATVGAQPRNVILHQRCLRSAQRLCWHWTQLCKNTVILANPYRNISFF